jgi:hypothetical protein
MSSTATGEADGADEQVLARDMIDVHGAEAQLVARDNARTAALAGQRPQARYWIRILGIIQQRRTSHEMPIPSPMQG